MDKRIERKINEFAIRRHLNKVLQKLAMVLACIAVFCTTYALMLPAVTQESEPAPHIHDDTCKVKVCICEFGEEIHNHDETCYETRTVDTQYLRQLCCQQTEQPHIHGELCYQAAEDPSQEPVLICDLVMEPHEHTDDCYVTETVEAYEEQVLVCAYSENVHTHDDSCYQWEVICGYEESVGSDVTADVETEADWNAMFEEYPYAGEVRKDLVGITKTQVGYTESERNFVIVEDGVRRGYTRYGAWNGTPYEDWSALFVSFCLHYAGADPEELPVDTDFETMTETWQELERYIPAEDYVPVPGDLVFLENETVGIVAEVYEANCQVVCGDVDGSVQTALLPLTDESIVGWGCTEGAASLIELPPEEEPEEETEESEEETEEESEEETEEETEEENCEEQEPIVPDIDPEILLDISDGPAFFIFAEVKEAPLVQRRFVLRNIPAVTETEADAGTDAGTDTETDTDTDTPKDIVQYLQSKGGSYFLTLLDHKNQSVFYDEENKQYIVQSNTTYKLTVTFNSPNGFVPGTYTYQISTGAVVEGGAGEIELNGRIVGTWSVTEDGLVTMVFNQNVNELSGVTISTTVGIHFPAENETINFDGKIHVRVEAPSMDTAYTKVIKFGTPGVENDPQGRTDPSKIYWKIELQGKADSQIPGSTLTDNLLVGGEHPENYYTESDMERGITFGTNDSLGHWVSWTVKPGDADLIWTATGWSYTIPKTAYCPQCRTEIELGNDGWTYYVDYSSTPVPMNNAGNRYYMNHVKVDSQHAYGGATFVHGRSLAEIEKNGTFTSDAAGGGFLWEVQATIPALGQGEKALQSWRILDQMYLMDDKIVKAGVVKNDAKHPVVTAVYNGTAIQVPDVRDATADDPFAWYVSWSDSDEESGVEYTQQIELVSRCSCTEETCAAWKNGHCTAMHYHVPHGGGWVPSEIFCTCWTEPVDTTFTLTYRTDDLSLVDQYGGIGYYVQNIVLLTYVHPQSGNAEADSASADVPIPGLFKKTLKDYFNGKTAKYTITVNEAKVALTDGSPLTIRDEMTDTLAFISGSLVISTEDAEGRTGTLRQDLDYMVSYDGTGDVKDAGGKSVHLLEIVILRPQPVKYTLNYDTTLLMPDEISEGVAYSNSAAITLWGQQLKENTEETIYAHINMAAQSYKVELFKTAADTGEPLPGATFGMFNAQGGLICSAVTDENGELIFQTNVEKGIILREHEIYYVQELRAPVGYQLDDTMHLFCFCDKADAECKTCQGVMSGTYAVRIPLGRNGKISTENVLMKYVLPATGGSGTTPYTVGGAALLLAAGLLLMYKTKTRRKGGTETS